MDMISQIRTGMVSVSDGKSSPEPARLQLTMELLTLQKLEIVTPSSSIAAKKPICDSEVYELLKTN